MSQLLPELLGVPCHIFYLRGVIRFYLDDFGLGGNPTSYVGLDIFEEERLNLRTIKVPCLGEWAKYD